MPKHRKLIFGLLMLIFFYVARRSKPHSFHVCHRIWIRGIVWDFLCNYSRNFFMETARKFSACRSFADHRFLGVCLLPRVSDFRPNPSCPEFVSPGKLCFYFHRACLLPFCLCLFKKWPAGTAVGHGDLSAQSRLSRIHSSEKFHCESGRKPRLL